MECAFIIQGEGRGHCTQALALKPILESLGIQVVWASVGVGAIGYGSKDWFFDALGLPPEYHYSPGFAYENGAVSLWATFRGIYFTALKDNIHFLDTELAKRDIDFVVNFYEPLVPLLKSKIPVITIGHQFMVGHPDYPTPAKYSKLWWSKKILEQYNKLVARRSKFVLGLSYYKQSNYGNVICAPPLLRPEILKPRERQIKNRVVIYAMHSANVPAILEQTKKSPDYTFVIYNDKHSYKFHSPARNAECKLISNGFVHDFLLAEYVVCSGGFETVCEAIYHDKRILMVPTPNHAEQALNCLDAMTAGLAFTKQDYDLNELLDPYVFTIQSCELFPKKEYVNFYREFFATYIKTKRG